MLSDLYQISYVVDNEGNVTNLTVLKNQTPQILSLRAAVLWEGVFYLPMNVVQELTGTTFIPDETGLRYSVTLPGLDVPQATPQTTDSATLSLDRKVEASIITLSAGADAPGLS